MIYLGFIILPLLFLGLAVFFIVRATTLNRRVTELESRLDVLERSVSGRPLGTPKTQSVPVPVPSSSSVPPSVPVPTPVPPRTSRTREEWEAFVGGRLLNRIGAFALIIGIGLFLKYAFDNNWISESVRVIIGGVSGLICLGGAYQTHRKGFGVFSQGLVGAGTAILYLSVYSSFNYYSLIPQWAAFLLMSLVTAVSLAQAVYYNAIVVGVLGWAGGFLTPWLLSTGAPNEVGLFTYIALLTVALLGLVVRKPDWIVLKILTFAAVWIVYFAWHVREYDVDVLNVTLFYVLVFWGLFVVADAALEKLGTAFDPPRLLVALFNALMGYVAVNAVVSRESEEWAGWTVLIMALVYIAPLILVRPFLDGRFARIQTSLVVAMAVLGCGLAYSEFNLVVSWSVVAAAAAWAAMRWNYRHLNIASLIVVSLAGLRLLGVDGGLYASDIASFTPVLNERFMGFVAITLASLSAWWFSSATDTTSQLRSSFLSIAVSVGALLITVETNDILRLWRVDLTGDEMAHRWFQSILILALVWTSAGAAFVWTGLRTSLRPIWVVGIIVLGLGVMTATLRGFAVSVPEMYVPVINLRFAILLSAALLTAGVGRMFAFRRAEPGPWRMLYAAASIGAAMIVFSVLTGETSDIFERSLSLASETEDSDLRRSIMNDLRDQQQLAVSSVWLLYSVTLMVVGFWRSSRGFRVISMVLFGITILKIFLYDLSFLETVYRIISFIGLGVILLSVSYAYQRYKHMLLGVDAPSDQKGAVL